MPESNSSFVKNMMENPKLLRPEIHKDSFFAECIEIANFKIYPFYDLFMAFSNKMSSGSCSIDPIAIIISNTINNKTDFYLLYFDESLKNEDYDKKILEEFCKEINYEIK